MEKQNIRIKLRAYDNKILDQSTEEIVNTVKRTGAKYKRTNSFTNKNRKIYSFKITTYRQKKS